MKSMMIGALVLVLALVVAVPTYAGSFSALAPGDVTASDIAVVYNAGTGVVGVQAPADTPLTSFNIASASSIFTGAGPKENLDGSFDNWSADNVFKATFGGNFGSLSFGALAQPGLSADMLLADLTVVGSKDGGGDLGDVKLQYVPEPSTMILLALGLLGLIGVVRRR